MKFIEEKKRMVSAILFICAIVFVAVYVIVNFTAVSAVFTYLTSVFSPVIIGFAIAYILNPILRLFEFKVYKKIPKKNVVRGLSIVSTYVVAIGFITAFLFLLIPQLIEAITEFVTNFDTYLTNTIDFINNTMNKFSSNSTFTEYVNEEAVSNFFVNLFTESGDIINTLLNYAKEYGMGLIDAVKNTVVGIFISIYVLISKEKLQAQVKKFASAVMPDKKRRRLGKYIMLTSRTFSGYFVGKIIGSCIVFVLMWTSMSIFGIEYALLVATIVSITDIIPVFGPIIGAIPSFFIIFVSNPTDALIFVVILLLIQQLEGNVISPKILGEATGISSLTVIIAIVVMGEWFGFVGMIIGVPVFAVGITVVKELIDTRLKRMDKSTDTADYYLKDSLADPHDEHVPIGRRMFLNIKKIVIKIKDMIVKKKNVEQTEEANAPAEEQTEEVEEEQTENIGNGDK